MLGCFGVPRFWLHSHSSSHQSRRGQSHLSAQPQTERGHRDDGPRPGWRGRRTSIPLFVITDKLCSLWRREFRHNAGGAPRVGGQAQPPHVSVPTQRPPSCTRYCGWAGALTTHNGTKIDLLAVAPKTVAPKTVGFWVDQVSLMWSDSSAHWESLQGTAFLGSHQAASCFWQVGGVVTLASQRAGQAGFAWHSDAGAACASQGRGRRQLPALPRRPRQCSTAAASARLADRAGHASLAGGATGCTFSGATIQGTACTRHFTMPCCHSANRFTRAGTTGSQTASSKGTFSRTALRLAVALFGEQAGLWWRSTTRGTSRQLLVEQYRATCCRGRRRAMPRPTLQATSPWQCLGPHSATWRRGALPSCSKGETTVPTSLPRKEQTHTSLLFASPRQLCPWPSKRRDGRPRPTSCSCSGVGTTPGLPRQEYGHGHRVRGSIARERRRSPRRLQVRLAFTHRSFTLLARQSSRPTPFQRAQLSIVGVVRWTVPSSSAPTVETSASKLFYGSHMLRSTRTTQGVVALSSGESEFFLRSGERKVSRTWSNLNAQRLG